MTMNRRTFFSALIAAVIVLPIEEADARRRTRRRKRSTGLNLYSPRGTTTGECPCNGGNVCVGPRGGRYCITSGGNKRYGV